MTFSKPSWRRGIPPPVLIILYSGADAHPMGLSTRSEFAVDENGLTADGYRRLVPASRKSMYLSRVIVAAVVVVICAVAAANTDVIGSWPGTPYLAAVIAVVVVVYCSVSPEIYYRRYRYRIDDDKVEIRKGIVYITHSMVPVERIHQVDVSRGPINRMFGLADVLITTAGGTVSIQYLEEPVAEEIATSLNQSVVGMLRERDRWGPTCPSHPRASSRCCRRAA